MAKKQRWRRSRSAGEGASPVEEAQEYDAVDPVDGETVEPVDPATPDPQPGLEPGPEPEAEHELEPDPEPELSAAPQTPGAGGASVRERPALPHVEERSGVSGWLFGGQRAEDVLLLQLLQAAHAKQAITTALVVALTAAVAGRAAREVLVVFATVLVGQTILGWHNDIVDRQRDRAHDLPGKPLATGRLQPETVWYAIVVATLLLVPLAITNGIRAGCLYLAAVAVGMLGNVVLRTGILSFWSWMVSYGLIVAFLSYGGWGGQAVGDPPEPVMVGLAALLGVGVHFMRAAWGLVADHADGWTYLPLRLGLKLGATRLLALSTVYTAGVVIALIVAGSQVGLGR